MSGGVSGWVPLLSGMLGAMCGLLWTWQIQSSPYACLRRAWASVKHRSRVRKALGGAGNGIYIAKLISESDNPEHARQIFDIFRGAPDKGKQAAPYAALAAVLARFDDIAGASTVLLDLGDQRIPESEIQEAMEEFYYPVADSQSL